MNQSHYNNKKEDCDRSKQDGKSEDTHDNPGDFAKWISENSELHGFLFEESWFDIGSFEMLEEANRRYEMPVLRCEK